MIVGNNEGLTDGDGVGSIDGIGDFFFVGDSVGLEEGATGGLITGADIGI